MRLQLPLKGLELRFDQVRFELDRAHRALLRFALIPERVRNADDRPIRHHFPVEVQEKHPLRLDLPRPGRLAR